MSMEGLRPLQPVKLNPDPQGHASIFCYLAESGRMVGVPMTVGLKYEIVHAEPVPYWRNTPDGLQDSLVIRVKGTVMEPRKFSDATVVFCDPFHPDIQTTEARNSFEFVVYKGDEITQLIAGSP